MSKKPILDLTEKSLSTEIVYRGFLKVHKDHVELPDGQKAYREYIKHPGAAMVIPILQNGNFIMVEQFRFALGKVFLEFPAGKIDFGETSEQTAHRELGEEIGYRTDNLRFLTKIHPVIGYSDEHIDLYVAENLEITRQIHQEDEFLFLREISPLALEQMIFEGQVTDVKTQIGFFWYQRSLKA